MVGFNFSIIYLFGLLFFFLGTPAEDLLESILSKDACKVGLPSLERLVQHPFWQEYVPKFHEQYMSGSDAIKQNLKLTNNAKEQIKIAAQKTEQRLRDEQRSVSILL